MQTDQDIVTGGVLEELTYSQLIDLWAEEEIARRLRDVELFSTTIVREAQKSGNFRVLPERGGFCDENGSVEVLVEVRDLLARCSRIGAWKERKFGRDDHRAFDRAYAKAMAHAIIQLLPATVWRRWIRATQR